MTEILEKPKLGEALRALRKHKGWTLSDLSKVTNMSVSTLSKIENNKMSLSYDKLVHFSESLQIDIGQLFQQQTRNAGGATLSIVTGRRSFNANGTGSAVKTDNYHYNYLAADLLKKGFVPIIIEVRCRDLAAFGDFIHHRGDEFSYVLEGELELHSDLYAPLQMKAGDSIYFDGKMGHAYINIGKGVCKLLNICSS